MSSLKTEAFSPRARLAPGTRASTGEPHAARGRQNRRGWLAAIVGVALLAGGVAMWAARRDTAPAYITAPVERGDIRRATSASGMVNPVETVQVGSYVSGRVQDLFCDYNTRVAKGQVCAKIDPRSYQALVEQAVSAVATAKAQLAKDRANLDYQTLLYGHRRTLSEHGVMSKESADEARSGYRQLEAQLQVDAATIAQHEAELQAARVNLDYADIVSPVEGTVVARNVTVGQTVTASFQTPTLFVIARDLTQMQVDANVSEADIGDIREGQKADFTVEAFPDRRFTGVVAQVRQAPISVQNVISYDVVIKTGNAELLLKPGMTATAHIILAEHEDVPRIAQQALRFNPAGAHEAASAERKDAGDVWALRDRRLVHVPVTLGLADETHVEVTGGGLQAGDRIVTGEQAVGEPAPGNEP
jgi:HlyD family secretion protein